jgi:hypothetical protein
MDEAGACIVVLRGFVLRRGRRKLFNVFEILGALNGKGWFRFLPIRCPRFAARRRRSRWCLGFWNMTAPALRGRIESRRQRRGSDVVGGGARRCSRAPRVWG